MTTTVLAIALLLLYPVVFFAAIGYAIIGLVMYVRERLQAPKEVSHV